jgi:hydrogenase maturation factor HypF (carbamoyltransferase family)
LFGIEPAVIARDFHASTGCAQRRAAIARIPVQHHHAHMASVLAEYGLTGHRREAMASAFIAFGRFRRATAA